MITVKMKVVRTTAITDKAASKMLKKFVDTKEADSNTNLMMNEEVKFQLVQVLAHLQGKKPQIRLHQDEGLYGQF
ncbi:hypothetical protein PsorP6_004466 [Peronosclerospora sorghi]|uniref:Uncharacterized protein n=1 Tax=Peronosclerospora sorghi TaxID=230839 RepID=A0ACC0VRX5_9STRA|nr:hypothetical protein PsorP6_004466 [Peronosclerospora sorghi]